MSSRPLSWTACRSCCDGRARGAARSCGCSRRTRSRGAPRPRATAAPSRRPTPAAAMPAASAARWSFSPCSSVPVRWKTSLAAQAVVPGDEVGRHGVVRVPDVRHVVRVVDRRGDVEDVPAHGRAIVAEARCAGRDRRGRAARRAGYPGERSERLVDRVRAAHRGAGRRPRRPLACRMPAVDEVPRPRRPARRGRTVDVRGALDHHDDLSLRRRASPSAPGPRRAARAGPPRGASSARARRRPGGRRARPSASTQHRPHALRRLEQDDRARVVGEGPQPLAALPRLARQEPLEREPVGRQAARRRARRSPREGPGTTRTSMPSSAHARTSRKPGSEIDGMPASRHERDVPPVAELGEDRPPIAFALVALEERDERRLIPSVREQPAGAPRVLRRIEVDGRERLVARGRSDRRGCRSASRRRTESAHVTMLPRCATDAHVPACRPRPPDTVLGWRTDTRTTRGRRSRRSSASWTARACSCRAHPRLRRCGPLPTGVELVDASARRRSTSAPVRHHASGAVERFVALARALDPAGRLWVAWPKKASKVATDLDLRGRPGHRPRRRTRRQQVGLDRRASSRDCSSSTGSRTAEALTRSAPRASARSPSGT